MPAEEQRRTKEKRGIKGEGKKGKAEQGREKKGLGKRSREKKKSPKRKRARISAARWTSPLIAAVFVLALTVVIYRAGNGSSPSGVVAWVLAAALILAFPLVGFLIGRWWAVLLPLVVAVLVVPAGDFAGSDLPSWEAALLQSIVEIPLIAIGVVIRSPLSRMVAPKDGQPSSVRRA